jgi:uncharacterized protein involved in response to NO
MRFSGWQTLRRNWLAGIIGLLFTVVLGAAAVTVVPAKYVTTSQVVLLPPISQPNASYNGVVNPYLGLAGLQSMAAVVSSAMMDDDTAKTLQQAGVSGYSVQYSSLSGGPILIAQATEPSAQQASSAIAALDGQIPATVARLQAEAGIAPASFITAKVIARPSTPAQSAKTQLRVAGLAVVAGLALTLLAVSVAEGWRVRRRVSRSRSGKSLDRPAAAPAFTETAARAVREPPR